MAAQTPATSFALGLTATPTEANPRAWPHRRSSAAQSWLPRCSARPTPSIRAPSWLPSSLVLCAYVSAKTWRDAELWEAIGIQADRVSAPALVWAVPATGRSVLAKLLRRAAEGGLPLHVSLIAMQRNPVAVPAGSPVLRGREPSPGGGRCRARPGMLRSGCQRQPRNRSYHPAGPDARLGAHRCGITATSTRPASPSAAVCRTRAAGLG